LRLGLRQRQEKRFTRVADLADRIKALLAQGERDVAREELARMAGWPFLEEVEFTGIPGLITKALGAFDASSRSAKQPEYYLDLIISVTGDSMFTSRFMSAYHDRLNDLHLKKITGYVSDEDLFNAMFAQWQQDNNMIRGAPRYWRARLYKSAFISEKSPVFAAAETILLLIKLEDFRMLFDNLKSNKRGQIMRVLIAYLKHNPPVTRAKQVPAGDRNTFLSRLIEAARKDFSLDKNATPEDVSLLYKAFQLEPPVRNSGFFDNLTGFDELALKKFVSQHPEKAEPMPISFCIQEGETHLPVYFYGLPVDMPGFPSVFVWAQLKNGSLQIFFSGSLSLFINAFCPKYVGIRNGLVTVDLAAFEENDFLTCCRSIALHEYARVRGLNHWQARRAQRRVEGYEEIAKQLEYIQKAIRFIGKFDNSRDDAPKAAYLLGRMSSQKHTNSFPYLSNDIIRAVRRGLGRRNAVIHNSILTGLRYAGHDDYLDDRAGGTLLEVILSQFTTAQVKSGALRVLSELNFYTPVFQRGACYILIDCLFDLRYRNLHRQLLRALGNLLRPIEGSDHELCSELMWVLRFVATRKTCGWVKQTMYDYMPVARLMLFNDEAQQVAMGELVDVFKRGVNILERQAGLGNDVFHDGCLDNVHDYFKVVCRELNSVLDAQESPVYSGNKSVRMAAVNLFAETLRKWKDCLRKIGGNGNTRLAEEYLRLYRFIVMPLCPLVYGDDDGRREHDVSVRLAMARVIAEFGGLSAIESGKFKARLLSDLFDANSNAYSEDALRVLDKVDHRLYERIGSLFSNGLGRHSQPDTCLNGRKAGGRDAIKAEIVRLGWVDDWWRSVLTRDREDELEWFNRNIPVIANFEPKVQLSFVKENEESDFSSGGTAIWFEGVLHVVLGSKARQGALVHELGAGCGLFHFMNIWLERAYRGELPDWLRRLVCELANQMIGFRYWWSTRLFRLEHPVCIDTALFGKALEEKRLRPASGLTLVELYALGLKYRESEPKRALPFFKDALKIDPGCVAAHLRAGELNYVLGKNRSALKYWAKAACLNKSDNSVYANIPVSLWETVYHKAESLEKKAASRE
jgi:hypothetical protein